MKQKLALFSQSVVTPEGVQALYILIQEGKIAALTPDKKTLPADVAIENCDGLVIMPGLIDTHIHINEPGRTEWEGFATATRAAAAGGVTTLFDMPLNSTPVTTTLSHFQEKVAAAEGKLKVDCGFWGGIVPGNQKAIEPLLHAGVFGFKTFLIDSGIADFPKSSKEDLCAVMPILAKHHRPLLVHAEKGTPLLEANTKLTVNPKSYRNYLASRPEQWETEAIAMLIDLAKQFNCPVHIVHLAAAQAIPLIIQAKQAGVPLTVETCPHYLSFSAEAIPDGDTRFKCAPPIRQARIKEKLWEALAKGWIDWVASDHSPSLPNLKHLESGDFAKAWGGVASLGLTLSILWTEAQQRGIGLVPLSRWLSEAPARFAGLTNQKGIIATGRDADLVVWDPNRLWDVTPETLHFRHPLSPYLNQRLRGKVERTYLRGVKIFDQGKWLDENLGKPLLKSYGKSVC